MTGGKCPGGTCPGRFRHRNGWKAPCKVLSRIILTVQCSCLFPLTGQFPLTTCVSTLYISYPVNRIACLDSCLYKIS